jgi:hypothetical protein
MRHWWIQSSLLHLAEAESRLLLSTAGSAMKTRDVKVGETYTVHTLEGGSPDPARAPLVLCHGYGQGAAAFALSLPQLTENVSPTDSNRHCDRVGVQRKPTVCIFSNTSCS